MLRTDALAPRFARAWRGVTAHAPAPELVAELVAAWEAPGRHYHDASHLMDGLRRLDPIRGRLARPNEVEVAWWFHDAIQAPGASDNEARSAEWAATALIAAGAPEASVERVRAMILATRHFDAPPSPDAAALLDLDLAILGADPPAYDAYAEGVRYEYGFLGDEMWAAGRAHFLHGLLARPALFHTAEFRAALEAPARENVRRELARLGG